jgi:hypothetical protein
MTSDQVQLEHDGLTCTRLTGLLYAGSSWGKGVEIESIGILMGHFMAVAPARSFVKTPQLDANETFVNS